MNIILEGMWNENSTIQVWTRVDVPIYYNEPLHLECTSQCVYIYIYIYVSKQMQPINMIMICYWDKRNGTHLELVL